MKKKFSSKFFVAAALVLSALCVTPAANAYDPDDAGLYSPSVSAQLGGYITQLNSYDHAFTNMDMYMLNSKEHRKLMKRARKSGSSEVIDAVNSTAGVNDVWTTPYTNFEKLPFKRGPKVTNISYGQYFGSESEIVELGNGWDGVFGVYAGYNGSHQYYNDMGIYQNGGTLGLVGMAYKENFFAGATINVGANGGVISDSEDDSLDFGMIMSGIAAKTGYNWELAKGKFIIQPSYKMSYSFVNLYNKKDVFEIDPLHVINIEPAIKFIGNFNSGWQPYASFAMVWSIMDRSSTESMGISSAEIAIKPFAKYGFGVRKIFGKRLTGFFQTYFTSGGKSGVGLQLGLSWALGKDPSKGDVKKPRTVSSLPTLPKTEVRISNVK